MATTVLALDALILLGAGVFLLVRASGHDARDHTAAVTQGVFALVGAGLFGLLALGCIPGRERVLVRTPALIFQVIFIPVAIGFFQSGRPEVGAPLAVSALLGGYGLVTGFRAGDRVPDGG